MKIVKKYSNEVSVGDMKPGAVFYNCGEYYLVTDRRDDTVVPMQMVITAVSLRDGTLIEMYDDNIVIPCEATVTVEQ
jgi:hypothetical protein